MNGLPGTVDYVVQYKSDDKQSYKTKYHTSPVMKYHVAGTDDDKSQAVTMRPSVTSLYLWMMAAIISVPPVLPLQLNTIPSPAPHIAAPIRQAMNLVLRPAVGEGRRPNRSPATEKP